MVRNESKISENLNLGFKHMSSESGKFKEQILTPIKRRHQGEKSEALIL